MWVLQVIHSPWLLVYRRVDLDMCHRSGTEASDILRGTNFQGPDKGNDNDRHQT
jgi:hypothetical protein